MAPSGPVLELRGITKDFGENRVLDNVEFSLMSGEIHALLGENGAGKTTLMNILRGLVTPTQGTILMGGVPVVIRSPQDASARGIGMVHQHFLLVPVFSVAENLTLAAQQHGILMDAAHVIEQSGKIARRLGWEIPFTARVADLPVGTQQRVEILKALLSDAKILLFDEPTAVLAPTEVEDLLTVLRTLRDEERSLVFVSHKLGEVMALCDRVTVLRRGKVVGSVAIADTNPSDLARRMVGDEAGLLLAQDAPRLEVGKTREQSTVSVVSVRNLRTPRLKRDDVILENISFELSPGEILGIAGVDGNGQSELFDVLAGLRPYQADAFTLDGDSVPRLTPGELARRGIAVIPPDRQRQGLALTLSVGENLLLDAIRLPQYQRVGLVQRGRLGALAERMREDFDVRSADLAQPVRSLSGGNQQKIVIARALGRKPKLLIAASPTRGLDVAATAYVHQKLREAQAQGAAIILISTELDEVLALSTRVAVLYEGRIAGVVAPDAPREQIGLLMGGNRELDNRLDPTHEPPRPNSGELESGPPELGARGLPAPPVAGGGGRSNLQNKFRRRNHADTMP